MTVTAVISTISTSFVYEDLLSHVLKIQNGMAYMENVLDNQLKGEKKISNEIKSRSLTFLDLYGNRRINKYMDYELINKILRKYKKDYIPKYLQEWIKFGVMNENTILSLKEYELK